MKRTIAALAAILLLLSACGSRPEVSAGTPSGGTIDLRRAAGAAGYEPFCTFDSADFDGAAYTADMFRDHAVTVLNFWFTGCIYCVQEMPELEALSHQWAEQDTALFGVCVDAGDGGEYDALARQILADCGVTYPNLIIAPGSALWDYISGIYGYPTTVLVDRRGRLAGEPIVGALVTQAQVDELNARIDAIIQEDSSI